TDGSTKILPENVPPKTENVSVDDNKENLAPPHLSPHSKRLKYQEEHKKTVEFSLNSDCPSTAAKPEKFFKLQEKNPIFNRRPLKNTGPPIFLYDSNIIYEAAKHYKIENQRREVLRERLSQKLGPIILQQYDGKHICDGVAITKVSRLYIGYQLFLEVKNEIGSGGSDPTIQAAIYYRDHWAQSISSPV
ncbi:5268_t:CDS:2, partial [Funneliformis caledonium]